MPKKSNYGNESISQHKGKDQVRHHVSTFLGSSDERAVLHSINEIVSNSVDEYKAGYGEEIIVKKYDDGAFSVEDAGRGIPLGYNKKEKKDNYVLLLETLFAGGKYDESNYESSLGLNGLGLTVTNLSAEDFEITSFRDGNEYKISYHKGDRVSDLKTKKLKSKKTGTIVKWKPDLEVFSGIDISDEEIVDLLKTQAVVNKGVKFIFESPTLKETYEVCYPEGILGRVNEIVELDYIVEPIFWTAKTKGKDRADRPEYSLDVNIALCFSNKHQYQQFFHNSSDLKYGGSPKKALEQATLDFFDKYLKKSGKYSKSDAKISFEDISDCLVFISSCFQSPANTVDFENQTKFSIANKYVKDYMTDFIREQLEKYSISNPSDMEKIAEQILINSRSRTSAETQRQISKKKLMQKSGLSDKIPNFTDCRSKDPNERELFIVEGNSAKGSVVTARNPEMQAVMPIRGKLLNCLKASPQEILKSELIMNLIKLFGCGMELNAGKKSVNSFDISKLKYNKILLTADADSDGLQINSLLITMIWKLCPELIRQGYIYVVEMPLYETYRKEKGKEVFEYAYTDKDLQALYKKHGTDKIKVQRCKGLGEMDPESMSYTAMNIKTRIITRVNISDVKKSINVLDLFMGPDVPPRRKYIEENSELYINEVFD